MPPRVGPTRQLTLLDSTSIIVGIIIGSAIYKSAPAVAGAVPNAAWLAAVWTLGGVLSLVGALCYAELAAMFPQEGGDYVYLTRALGRWLGFLFAWAQFWIVRPGSIGALAYVFADYANQLFPLGAGGRAAIVYAAGSIVILTGVNVLGVREGKWTQNLLTAAKVAALIVVAAAGFFLISRGSGCDPCCPGESRLPLRHDPGPLCLWRLERNGLRRRRSPPPREEHPPRRSCWARRPSRSSTYWSTWRCSTPWGCRACEVRPSWPPTCCTGRSARRATS